MKKLAVFTSGGDAPGMNACIRAVVRTALYNDTKVYGILRGYEGMINGDLIPLNSHSVSNIIQRGGTILKSARSEAFKTVEGRSEAALKMKSAGIEGIIAIGGDGTFKGAELFEAGHNIPVIGVPGTIDNDLFGTDHTIGFDTAVNTALDAIDKIRDTADSHDMVFFIEVMGRDSGFIALDAGISGGAEAVLIPESDTDFKYVADVLVKGWKRKKTSAIIVVAEGDEEGGAFAVVEKVKKQIPKLNCRVSIIGHLQRGGKPTAHDRLLASRLGSAAVEKLLRGESNKMTGILNNKITFTLFKTAYTKRKKIDMNLVKLAELLSL